MYVFFLARASSSDSFHPQTKIGFDMLVQLIECLETPWPDVQQSRYTFPIRSYAAALSRMWQYLILTKRSGQCTLKQRKQSFKKTEIAIRTHGGMAVVNHKNLGGLINIHDLGKTMHRGLIDGWPHFLVQNLRGACNTGMCSICGTACTITSTCILL